MAVWSADSDGLDRVSVCSNATEISITSVVTSCVTDWTAVGGSQDFGRMIGNNGVSITHVSDVSTADGVWNELVDFVEDRDAVVVDFLMEFREPAADEGAAVVMAPPLDNMAGDSIALSLNKLTLNRFHFPLIDARVTRSRSLHERTEASVASGIGLSSLGI